MAEKVVAIFLAEILGIFYFFSADKKLANTEAIQLKKDHINVLLLVRNSGGAGVGLIGAGSEGGSGHHGLDHLVHHHHHQQQQQHQQHRSAGPQGGSRSVQGIEMKLQSCFHCLLSLLLCPKKNTCNQKHMCPCEKTFCTMIKSVR